jgi:hypothetical protein
MKNSIFLCMITLCITAQFHIIEAKNNEKEEGKTAQFDIIEAKNKDKEEGKKKPTSMPTLKETIMTNILSDLTSSTTSLPTSAPTDLTSSPTSLPTQAPTVSPTIHPTSYTKSPITTRIPTISGEHDLNWYLHSIQQKNNSTIVSANTNTATNKTMESQSSLRQGEELSSQKSSQTTAISTVAKIFEVSLVFGLLSSAYFLGLAAAHFVK